MLFGLKKVLVPKKCSIRAKSSNFKLVLGLVLFEIFQCSSLSKSAKFSTLGSPRTKLPMFTSQTG